MLTTILKNLSKKFTTYPKYNQDNKLKNFIATWPFISFFMFTSVKMLFFPKVEDKPNYETLQNILIKTSVTVFVFHGILYEYMPNNIYSDIIQGIITSVITPSNGVLRTCMAISRRKYPLYLIWVHNMLIVSIAYNISLKTGH
jgi:hypothetical protein